MKGVPGTKHISYKKSEDTYIVTKCLNGKNKHMGSAKTLISALMIRDYCQSNNWEPYPKKKNEVGEKYIHYRKRLNVYEIIKYINGSVEYFGRYHSLEEAVKWRDFFIENDWDTDLRLIGTPNKNICFKQGKYRIYKTIDGHEYYFGSFDSYEEAEKRVNEMKLIGWENIIYHNERLQETSTKNIVQLPNGNYQIKKMINGKTYFFGVFSNYQDAVDEVKLLRKCNWDYDALESIDDSIEGESFLDGKMSTKVLIYKPPNGRIDYGRL